MAIITFHCHRLAWGGKAVFVVSDHAKGTRHGTGGAIDTLIWINEYRVQFIISENRTRETSLHTGRGAAVSATVGEAFIIQTNADMDPRLW